jgi:hypothetical protein
MSDEDDSEGMSSDSGRSSDSGSETGISAIRSSSVARNSEDGSGSDELQEDLEEQWDEEEDDGADAGQNGAAGRGGDGGEQLGEGEVSPSEESQDDDTDEDEGDISTSFGMHRKRKRNAIVSRAPSLRKAEYTASSNVGRDKARGTLVNVLRVRTPPLPALPCLPWGLERAACAGRRRCLPRRLAERARRPHAGDRRAGVRGLRDERVQRGLPSALAGAPRVGRRGAALAPLPALRGPLDQARRGALAGRDGAQRRPVAPGAPLPAALELGQHGPPQGPPPAAAPPLLLPAHSPPRAPAAPEAAAAPRAARRHRRSCAARSSRWRARRRTSCTRPCPSRRPPRPPRPRPPCPARARRARPRVTRGPVRERSGGSAAVDGVAEQGRAEGG